MSSAVEICLAQEAKLKDTQVKENAVRFNPTTYQFERWTGSAWSPVGSNIDESNLVHKTGNETIAGTKTFNDTIVGSVSGNAGSADTATKLKTARSINVTDGTNNGTAANFDGSGDSLIHLPSTIKANLDGKASSATRLATARTIRTNLGSTSTASFNGTANISPGVTGVLPVANGGTGNSTGKAPSAVTAGSAIKDGVGNVIANTYVKAVNNKAPSDGNVNVAARNVGDEWHSFTGKIPAGGVPYCGQTVTRVTYADLWAYVQVQGLVKTESEWQSLNNSQNGNVPFYSDGDGSSTFRMPKIVGYIKGAASTDETGAYTAEGLPNITGEFVGTTIKNSTNYINGAFTKKEQWNGNAIDNTNNTECGAVMGFAASNSNAIYGNSTHVIPETITVLFGVYAYGELTVTGSTTTDALATGLANVEAEIKRCLPLSGGTMTGNIRFSNNGDVGKIFVTPADASDWRSMGLVATGNDGEVGGSFQVFRTDSPNHAGGFTCRAEMSSRFCDLYGTPDGVLQWDGHDITHVIETWVASDSTCWYRKWSDGWLEQGGRIVVDSSEVTGYMYSTVRLTYPTPFKRLLRWQCQARHDCFTAGFNTEGAELSSVEVYQKNTQGNNFTNPFVIWYACGY